MANVVFLWGRDNAIFYRPSPARPAILKQKCSPLSSCFSFRYLEKFKFLADNHRDIASSLPLELEATKEKAKSIKRIQRKRKRAIKEDEELPDPTISSIPNFVITHQKFTNQIDAYF